RTASKACRLPWMSETMATCIRLLEVTLARTRVLNALGLAAVTAEVAARALSPRDGTLRPVAVEAGSYFSPQEIGRARRYARPQRMLGLAAGAAETLAIVGLARRPPRRDSIALAAARLSLVGTVAPLPLRAVMRERARGAGVGTPRWGGGGTELAQRTADPALPAAAPAPRAGAPA